VNALVALALAGALGCWPHAPAPSRLRTVAPRPPVVDGPDGTSRAASALVALLRRRPPAPLVAVGGAGFGALTAGVGGAVAALVLGTVVLRLRRGGRRRSDRAAATQALAEGLGSFAAELRAGAPPAAAARAAARDAGSGTTGPGDATGLRATASRIVGWRGPRHQGATCSRALALVEATAHLGGDVPMALRSAATADPLAGDDLRRVAGAWALAERHGIGLAGLTEAVAVDLRARSRFDGALRAKVAGPRATATVLAVLPVLGVLLGEGIGARPWAVLSGGLLGQGLLVVGVGLVAAGIEWTERIVAGVTR